MRFILRIVWLQDEFIRKAISVYINNIFVNENIYPDASVKDSEVDIMIRKWCLISRLRSLGIKNYFGNKFAEIPSICKKLLKQFPV